LNSLKATLAETLESSALGQGFALASTLDLALAGDAIAPHVARYDQWLAAGRAGAMQYLERGRDRRADPRVVFAEARSVLCVALPYPKRPSGAPRPSVGPRYARYIHGRDYHEDIAERLERAMREAAERSRLGSELRWKVCVDTSAVLERSWAMLAGLGWIGKNTLLIHPKLGSYFFLGIVLLNQETGQGPRPLPDYCGHCTRCLDGCPTRALTEPRWLDSRRCISYWTLEKRGALEIAESDKRAMGTWIAGCDICQEVCPFNRKPAQAELEQPSPAVDVANPLPAAERVRDWESLLRETPDEYRARVKDSALSRIKPAQFSRNLAITLANAIESEPGSWATRLRPLIAERLASETDDVARAEWARCLLLHGSTSSAEGLRGAPPKH
jgi:epoxyqueuosine reductase